MRQLFVSMDVTLHESEAFFHSSKVPLQGEKISDEEEKTIPMTLSQFSFGNKKDLTPPAIPLVVIENLTPPTNLQIAILDLKVKRITWITIP